MAGLADIPSVSQVPDGYVPYDSSGSPVPSVDKVPSGYVPYGADGKPLSGASTPGWLDTIGNAFEAIPGQTESAFGGLADYTGAALKTRVGDTPAVQALQGYGKDVESAGAARAAPYALSKDASLPKRVAYDVISGAPTMGAGLALGAATDNPLAPAAMFGALGAGQAYGENRDKPNALSYASASGAVNALSALPVSRLLGSSSSYLLPRIGRSAAEFGGISTLQQAADIGLRKGLFDENTSVSDAISKLTEAGLVGGVTGGLMGTLPVGHGPQASDRAAVSQDQSPPVQSSAPGGPPTVPPPASLVPVPRAAPAPDNGTGMFGAAAGELQHYAQQQGYTPPETGSMDSALAYMRDKYGIDPRNPPPPAPPAAAPPAASPSYDSIPFTQPSLDSVPGFKEGMDAGPQSQPWSPGPGDYFTPRVNFGERGPAALPAPGADPSVIDSTATEQGALSGPNRNALPSPSIPVDAGGVAYPNMADADAVRAARMANGGVVRLDNTRYLVRGSPDSIEKLYPGLSGGRYNQRLNGRIVPADIMSAYLKATGMQNDAVDIDAHQASTSPTNDLQQPTDGQKAAGNYKMGHTTVQGLMISIENPKGSARSGTDADGKPWSVTMQNHYGYIKNSVGADKEHMDAFIGPNPANKTVYVVDQNKPDGSFDEHKAMIGFNSMEQARAAYHANYSADWKGFRGITAMPMDEFKQWVKKPQHEALTGEGNATQAGQQQSNDRQQHQGAGAQPGTRKAGAAAREGGGAPAGGGDRGKGGGQEPQAPKLTRQEVLKKRWQGSVRPRDSDDLITALRKAGGLNVNNEGYAADFKVRLKHLDALNKTFGLRGIEQTGKDRWGYAKGMTFEDALKWAQENGFVGEDEHGKANWEDLYELLSQAESGKPIYGLREGGAQERLREMAEREADREEWEAATKPQEFDQALSAHGVEEDDAPIASIELEARRILGDDAVNRISEYNDHSDEAYRLALEEAVNAQRASEANSRGDNGTEPRLERTEGEAGRGADREESRASPEAAGTAAEPLKLESQSAPKSEAPTKSTQNDLFGGKTETQQAVHDRDIELAARRRGEQVDAGIDGGLFSGRQKQSDITDQAASLPILKGDELGDLPERFYIDHPDFGRIEVDRRFDVPLGAIASKDLRRVYVDRGINLVKKVGDRLMNRTLPLIRHEITEGKAEAAGANYTHSHRDVAVPAENADVRAAGFETKPYDESWKDDLAQAARKTHGANTPPDAIEKPFEHPHTQRQREALAEVEGNERPGSIKDFGEKLPPAQRALAATLNQKLDEDEIEKLSLGQIWPLSENEAIEDKFAAAVAHAARAEIPAKPRVGYKVKRWAKQVNDLRRLAGKIVDGSLSREQFLSKAHGFGGLTDFVSKVKLLEKIDRKDWGRVGEVRELPNAYRYEGHSQVPVPQSFVSIDGKGNRLEGSGDINDHLDAVNQLLGKAPAEQKMQFEIRQRRGDGKVFVNKKGDGQYRPLMEFDSAEEARAAINNRHDDLVKAWDGIKERDNVTERDLRTEENRPRSGQDWRRGRDVGVEEFQNTFGFRGGEFGKWVSQGAGAQERQFFLNNAYDALMDLASIVGVPPKAISLDGTLGIAFGSRGSGWASAHFEPSNLVINLTKPRGAGALAHEWFHALDNYFSRLRGGEHKASGQRSYRDENYITHKPEPLYVNKRNPSWRLTKEKLEGYRARDPNAPGFSEENWMPDPKHPEGVRPEVEARFADLVKALDQSPMAERAKTLDGIKESGDGYWSRTLERAARSFENFVMEQMLEKGYHNDFLANVRPVEETRRNPERYPYLMPSEVGPIRDAFKALFDAIQTKDTDRGVAMFSRGDSPAEQRFADEGRNVGDLSKMLSRLHGTDVTVRQVGAPTTAADATAKLVKRLFGREVVFVRSNDRFMHGAYIGGDKLFVDADAPRPSAQIMGHELLHSLRMESPSTYMRLVHALRGAIDDDKAAEFINKLDANYLRDRLPRLSDSKAEEELIAEVVGDHFADPKFIRGLQKNLDPSLFQRVAAHIADWVDRIKTALGVARLPAEKRFLADTEAARKAVTDALTEASQKQQQRPTEPLAQPAFARGDSEDLTEPKDSPAVIARKSREATKTILDGLPPAHVTKIVGRGLQREALASIARKQDQSFAQMKSTWKAMDGRLRTDRAGIFNAIDQWENGHAADIRDPLYREFFTQMDAANNERKNELLRRGIMQGAIEAGYFSHIWDNPDAAREAIIRKALADAEKAGDLPAKEEGESQAQYVQRVLASKGFTRKRTIMTVKEGMDLGLKLKSDNPVDIALMHLHQMDKVLAFDDLKNDLAHRGWTVNIGAGEQPPPGFAKIDDPLFTKWGLAVSKDAGAGPAVVGHVAVPEPIARDINNYLSPSLNRNPVWRWLRAASNFIIATRLGWSLFHFGLTTYDTVASHLAGAVQTIGEGQGGRAIGLLVKTPISMFTSPFEGAKLAKLWSNPAAADPQTAAVLRALESGGARLHMDPTDMNGHLTKLVRAIRQRDISTLGEGLFGKLGTAAGALAEAPSYPIMRWLVPFQKMTAKTMLMKLELERVGRQLGTGNDYAATVEAMHPDALRQIAAKVVDQVDDRLGQYAYDNIFMNRRMRDIGHASIQSLGWNYGSARVIGGGIKDIGHLIKPEDLIGPLDRAGSIDKVKMPRLTQRLAYLVAMNGLGMALNAGIGYAVTGVAPNSVADFFSIRTGRKNQDGSDERMVLPTYMRDEWALFRHPMQKLAGDSHATVGETAKETVSDVATTISHKLHPGLSMAWQLAHNRDYFGNQIVNPDDPAGVQGKQLATYLLKNNSPYSVQGAMQSASLGKSVAQEALPFIGVTPAPSTMTRSDFQNFVGDAYHNSPRNSAGRTPEQAARSQQLSQAITAYRQGDRSAFDALSPKDKVEVQKMGRTDVVEYRFKQLTLQQQLEALDRATPEEVQTYHLAHDILHHLSTKGGKDEIAGMDPDQRSAFRSKIVAAAKQSGMSHTAALMQQ